MKLETLSNGMFGSNSYILLDNGEAALIDAGVPCKDVLDILNKNSTKLKIIILTHGHIDHICSVDDIKNNTGAKVLIHNNDSECLTRGDRNLSSNFMKTLIYHEADQILNDGNEIRFGDVTLKIIHTPGHTMGGCCILTENILFTGDTLFAGSIGRTDFYGGDFNQIINSIKDKLLVLPENTKVYSGHGNETTIGTEIKNNPFLK